MENLETNEDFEPDRNGGVTILDVLGVDLCRDAILDHVHIRDIVRSERVCWRWRRAVLDYLPRCRNLTLSIYQRSRVLKYSHRTVMIRDTGSFSIRKVVEKLGPLIVSLYTNRNDKEFYDDIGSHCPNLRYVVLKHLSSKSMTDISQQQLGRTFRNIKLEKIKLVKCDMAVGKTLHYMNLNSLKSISFINCNMSQRVFKYVSCRFKNVTSLEMFASCFFQVQLMLVNMPKLENISLRNLKCASNIDFVKYYSRLNLKYLDLRENYINERDEFLECLAKSCKKLEYLNIASSIQSPCGRGLAALVLRPSPGTLLCFTRVESLEALLQFLQPMNDVLVRHKHTKVTLEMLKEAMQSKGQKDPLEIRLAYPVARNVESHPEIKIIINVSFNRIADNGDGPDNVDGQHDEDDNNIE